MKAKDWSQTAAHFTHHAAEAIADNWRLELDTRRRAAGADYQGYKTLVISKVDALLSFALAGISYYRSEVHQDHPDIDFLEDLHIWLCLVKRDIETDGTEQAPASVAEMAGGGGETCI